MGLNESPEPLQEADPPSLVPLPSADPAPTGDVALLLHLDDLNPETLKLDCRVTRVGGLVAHAPDASEQVRQADREAMADALARAGQWFGCDAAMAVPGWENGLPVVTAWAPVGPSAGALAPDCLRVRRRWDELTWPHATRGYFQVKSATPAILRAMSAG
jgi:deoxyribodipyrimidine photo-lyase